MGPLHAHRSALSCVRRARAVRAGAGVQGLTLGPCSGQGARCERLSGADRQLGTGRSLGQKGARARAVRAPARGDVGRTSVGRSSSRRSPSAVRMSPSPRPLVDAPATLWWGEWYSLEGGEGAKSRRPQGGERGRLIYSHPYPHERYQYRTHDLHAPSAGGAIARLIAHVHAHLCAPKRACAGSSRPKRRRPQPAAAGELAEGPDPRASASAPGRRARPIEATGTTAEGPSRPTGTHAFRLSWRQDGLSSRLGRFLTVRRF